MRIHRFHGRTAEDALQRARAAHGDQALVLSQEVLPNGSVAIAVCESQRGPAADGGVLVPARPLPSRLPLSPGAPSTLGARVAPGADPGPREVEQRLLRAGASPALIERVLAAVRASGTRGVYAIDAGARALGALFPVAPSPRRAGRPRLIAWIGPSGAGKTTTIAKLGRRLAAAGRRVAFATMDLERVGAAEQLRAHAELLELPFEPARDARELARAIARHARADAILFDTPGIAPRDRAGLERLAGILRGAATRADLEVYLVLAASTSAGADEQALRAFALAEPTAAAITKLDEAPQPGPVLECGARVGSGIAFLCDGPDVRAHLHRPTPDHFADLLLRGRIA